MLKNLMITHLPESKKMDTILFFSDVTDSQKEKERLQIQSYFLEGFNHQK